MVTEQQEHDSKQIEKECEEDLKEIASFYGGWDELRAVIKRLEENQNEAAFDRYMENRLNAESSGEFAHRMAGYQRLK